MIKDVIFSIFRMTSLCIIDTDIDNAGKDSKELRDKKNLAAKED